MERNDAGTNAGQGGQSEANEFSGSAPTPLQGEKASGFDFTGASESTEKGQAFRDRAKNVLDNASGKLADVGSTVRERAGTAKDKLADALESGAERLRERTQGVGVGGVGGVGVEGGGATLAGATAPGSTPIQGDGRIAQVSDRVAGGMDATAAWLRDADLEGLKLGLESQVKEHPGRTLLIAVGLGYLIGRAFRGNQ
jgi:ElaB/YqjD/DUF883 family membrane-anchored ribosome-binding protein